MKRQIFLVVGWLLLVLGTIAALNGPAGSAGAVAVAGAILLEADCIATVIVMSSSNVR